MVGPSYKPLPPDALYLSANDWDRRRGGEAVVKLSPFALAGASDGAMIDLEGRRGRSFAAERPTRTPMCSTRSPPMWQRFAEKKRSSSPPGRKARASACNRSSRITA